MTQALNNKQQESTLICDVCGQDFPDNDTHPSTNLCWQHYIEEMEERKMIFDNKYK